MDKLMYQVTKEQLIGALKPAQTRTYKPMEHERLIDLTLEGIQKAGFIVDKEMYTAAKGGQEANGRYTIKNVADREMALEVGWQNSYNKKLTLKFAIGGHIFICSNGAVVGDMGNFKKKHIGDIQEFAPEHINEYILSAGDTFKKLQDDRDKMKNIEMTKKTTAELIGRLYLEEDIIKAEQLAIIKKEIDAPTFDYGASNSLWEVYNHVTYSFKDAHPSKWYEQHQDLHNFVVNESGLLVEPKISSGFSTEFIHVQMPQDN